MNLEQINQIVNSTDFTYFGLRTVEGCPSIGDTLPVSLDFNNDYTPLDGACATELVADAWNEVEQEAWDKAYSINYNYPGDTMVLVASNFAEYGDDEAEIVMRNAIVLAVIEQF